MCSSRSLLRSRSPWTHDHPSNRIDTGDAPPWSQSTAAQYPEKGKTGRYSRRDAEQGGCAAVAERPASPAVLAPKKIDSFRLCVDYGRLNDVTVRDAYLYPAMESIISSLGGARVFTTLDCSSGFFANRTAPE